ncbi:HAD-IIA family hydrolase [Myxococcota bacterium]|nr:HAD-IIA family hydrolase [Myxococcota bacterium]MBU1537738.1 HAD-IIA family hydrolase [Myxococcota bacterium]
MSRKFTPPRAFLLDLDGTLYVGPRLMEATPRFLAALRERSIPHIFLTNNSSQSAREYYEKLVNRGIDLTIDQVLTSGDSAIRYLKKALGNPRVYLVGTPSLEDDFLRAGFTLDEDDPQCVVLGFDTGITYRKLEIAARHLYRGVPYFATQPDITCITERGLTPDVGVFIAGLKIMTGREPEILGKPSIVMIDAAMERMGLASLEGVAMVGDQLDTDITMGVVNGLISILLLSGETSLEKAQQFHLKPTHIFDHIGILLEKMLQTSTA